MAAGERADEQLAEEILGVLRGDEPALPEQLEGRTLSKVRATITVRDLVDLTTIVFVLRFCAPVIDLIAAMFGVEPNSSDRRTHDE